MARNGERRHFLPIFDPDWALLLDFMNMRLREKVSPAEAIAG
ncbi:MAG: hypothetical protein ACTHMI_12040 [Mucilaginibacter sp.]